MKKTIRSLLFVVIAVLCFAAVTVVATAYSEECAKGEHSWCTFDDTDPSCEDKQIEYFCLMCSEEKTVTITGTGKKHKWYLNDKQVLCLGGEAQYGCYNCSDIRTETVVGLGHDWYTESDTTPSCGDQEVWYSCRRCQEPEARTIPGTGEHKWSIEDEVFICEGGKARYNCDNCHEIKYKTLAGKGHKWSTWYDETPSCEDKVISYSCSRCHSEKSETIPGVGEHDWVADSDDTRICVDYEISYSCRRCWISEYRTVRGTGKHKWTKESTYSTEATLKKNGKLVEVCDECFKRRKTTVYKPTDFILSQDSFAYNGKQQKPTVTVKDSKGNIIKAGKNYHYTVSYEPGRTEPGRYDVIVTFRGNYEGQKILTYTIAPKATSKITATQTTSTITLKWNKVTGADGYLVYQYNKKSGKYDKLGTVTGTTYKISKLKAGTKYKFRVRAYTKDDGTIWGKVTDAFETATKPAQPNLTVKASSSGKVSLSWTNVSGESGYQVYCSTKKDSGFKKVDSYKANVVKGSMSKLTSGKTYYFKVRAYTKTDSGTVYSSWSAVKSVKVK